MSQVSGVIGRVNDKQWNGKTFYSLALKGQDGWYNTGMKRPPAVNTSVRFETKKNDKGYNQVEGSIEVLADGEAASAGSVADVARQSSGAGDGGKSAYWTGKEARDLTNDAARELGASRNTAIAIIDLALKNEIVKLPAPAKREEYLWTLLNKYTAKLMGKDDVESAATKEPTASTKSDQAETFDDQSDNWS